MDELEIEREEIEAAERKALRIALDRQDALLAENARLRALLARVIGADSRAVTPGHRLYDDIRAALAGGVK